MLKLHARQKLVWHQHLSAVAYSTCLPMLLMHINVVLI